MDDPRFSKFQTDPKFRTIPKKVRKVKIDERFQSLLKDKKFVSKASVDKRGRPGNFSTKENYEKFYELESSSSEDSDDEEEEQTKKKAPKKSKSKRDEVTKAIKNPDVDYARGEAVLSDSSSGEGDSSDDDDGNNLQENEESEEFDKWGELDHDAESTEEMTSRLAVCNMDWDRVGAQDLFIALGSFCPPGTQLLKVTIYPTDFGKERMKEEETLGPEELRSKNMLETSELDENFDEHIDQDDARAMEKIRKYQVNRLNYYFALAEFSSPEAAQKVYEECDGVEYELSGIKYDLRVVSDDREFHDDAKDECGALPDAEKYKPKLFCSSALSLGKVDLTWDETDPERMAAMKKAFDEANDDNYDALKQYLATTSDEEEETEKPSKKGQVPDCDDFGEVSEEDDEAVIAKYRALLGDATKGSGNKDDRGDDDDDDEESKGMEITFIPEADKRAAAKEKAKEKMTPWEKYLEKKKEKRKAKWDKKKQEAADEASSDNDNEEDEDEEEDDDIPSDVDMNDPFFKTEIQKMDRESQSKKTKKKGKASANQKPKEEPTKSDLSLLVMDSDDDKSHFDYKQIVKHESKSKKAQKKAKRKEKQVQEDNFKLDLADSRFSAIFDNPKVKSFYTFFPTECFFSNFIFLSVQRRPNSSILQKDQING